MFRKVFECKFPDGAAATEAVDKAGWEYAGLRGIFSKHHLYKGGVVNASRDRLEFEKYELKLFDNGAVELCIDKATGILGMTCLPRRVWSSLESYQGLEAAVAEVNRQIMDQGLLLESHGHKDFRLFKMEPSSSGIRHAYVTPELAVFQFPKQALQWVAENVVSAS